MEITVNNSDWEWAEDIEGETMPILVLGMKCHEWEIEKGKTKYNFNDGRKWRKIEHQTAGNACHHHYILGTIIEPKSNVFKNMVELSGKWIGTNCGVFGVSLNTVLEYREDLKNLFDVDCNGCYDNFEEAIYPIDCTRENLKNMTDTVFPEDLNNLISWEDELSKFCGCVGRWNLWILGANSD